MLSTRFSLKSLVLLAIGALMAAGLLAGCTAPDTNERAAFSALAGHVVDAGGNPIPGASVQVISLNGNVLSPILIHPTDATGTFTITALQAGIPVQVIVSAPGYVSAPLTISSSRGLTTIINPDNTPIFGAVILRPISAQAAVGAAGARITAPVFDPATGYQIGTAVLDIPAGSMSSVQTVSLTPLVNLPISAVGNPLRSRVLAPGTTLTGVSVPLAAVRIDPSNLSFNTPLPTLKMPLTSTTAQVPVGTMLKLFRLDEGNGVWQQVSSVEVVLIGGIPNVIIPLSRFGTYYVGVDSNWTFGAQSAGTYNPINFPPATNAPKGYAGLVPVRVNWDGANSDHTLAFLNYAFSGVTSEVANGFEVFGVPCAPNGMIANSLQVPVSVTVFFPGGTQTYTGIYHYWHPIITNDLPEVPHYQGHGQGGGIGG